MASILSEERKVLAERERVLLEDLVDFLHSFGAPPGDPRLVRRTLFDTRDLFLLVIVGEFNAGKSAFINALLGDVVALEGSIPTTDRVTVLKHGLARTSHEQREGVVEKSFPNEFLREVAVVDTPGTNAVIRHHEELSRDFVPRSDLVLFITSADRPFTQSERDYLDLIRAWGKKVVLVVNKMDLLEFEEIGRVRGFVEEQVASLLGFTPPVFMVSSRVATRAKNAGTSLERYSLMQGSGFDKLEGHVLGLLKDEDRVRLKLESPLGVVEEMVRRYEDAVEGRTRLLGADLSMCRNIEEQFALHQEEMKRDFAARVLGISNIVSAINDRADEWFEENIQITNAAELLRREKVQERFKKEVVADTDKLVKESVEELVGWMVERNLKQWNRILEYANLRRQAEYDGELVSEVDDGFEYYRAQLLRSVVADAENVIESHDHRQESEQLALSLQGAVARTAAAEIGALGIGTGVLALTSAVAVDITGVTAAVLIAGLGLYILPDKRRKARAEFRSRTKALRERLDEVVKDQFDVELAKAVETMRGALSPYVEFVTSEYARMETARSSLTTLRAETESLRAKLSPAVAASL